MMFCCNTYSLLFLILVVPTFPKNASNVDRTTNTPNVNRSTNTPNGNSSTNTPNDNRSSNTPIANRSSLSTTSTQDSSANSLISSKHPNNTATVIKVPILEFNTEDPVVTTTSTRRHETTSTRRHGTTSARRHGTTSVDQTVNDDTEASFARFTSIGDEGRNGDEDMDEVKDGLSRRRNEADRDSFDDSVEEDLNEREEPEGFDS